MDKLVAIRIKHNDGTYSNEIPLSVLAVNIDWDGTHSLVDVLGNVDLNKGSIQEQINALITTITPDNVQYDLTHTLSDVLGDVDLDKGDLQTQIDNISDGEIQVDSTLAVAGKAADAKAVGDNLKNVVRVGNSNVTNFTSIILGDTAEQVNLLDQSDLIGINTRLSALENGGIQVDQTLSVQGMAADAKATGDAIHNLQGLVGTPLVAATAASMTNTDKIYVYTGSETGYTNGNWYYYDGTAWTSGGVYNSIAMNMDAVPTSGSSKPVTSGGIKAALDLMDDDISSLNEDIANLSESAGDLKSAFKNSFVDGEYEISKNYPENEWITVSYSQGTNQGTGYYNRNGELLPGVHHHYDIMVKGADGIYISANNNAGTFFGIIKINDTIYNRFPATQGQQYSISLDPNTEYTVLVNAFDGFDVLANIHYPETTAKSADLLNVFEKTGELFSTARYDGLYRGGIYEQLDIDGFAYSTEVVWCGVWFKLPVRQNTAYEFSFDILLSSGGCFADILDEGKTTQLIAKTVLSSGTWKNSLNSGTNNYLYVRFEGNSANSSMTITNGTFTRKKSAYSPFHIVRRPFAFSGKTCVFIGDSITRGNTDGTSVTVNGYPKLFCDAVGATMTNLGVSGATMTANFMSQLQSANKSCDYLFVAGGVNDWQTGVSLDDFATAVGNICEYINTNFLQTTKVIFITPINQAGYDIDHAVNAFTELQAYRDIITQTAIENDEYTRFTVLQGNLFGFPEAGDNPAFISSVFGDKLHPSELGYKLYSAGLFTALC